MANATSLHCRNPRPHVIAWVEMLERRELPQPTIRRKLSAISSLFDYLCDKNALAGNSVDGVRLLMVNNNEGSAPTLSDAKDNLAEGFPDVWV